MLRYFNHEVQGCAPVAREICVLAARHGHVNVLNWGIVHAVVASTFGTSSLLNLGDSYVFRGVPDQTVESVRRHLSEVMTQIVAAATSNGHLDVLVFLDEHGFTDWEWPHGVYPHTESAREAMYTAVNKGHLDVVKWLAENPKTSHLLNRARAVDAATSANQEHVLEYLANEESLL